MANDKEYISAINLPGGSKKYIKDEEVREVVTGIDETGNNYIEMKSGRREYLATTVPTGNIPTGSVAIGFDEGIFTYKSGTKVSEGVPTVNLFDVTDFSVGTTTYITKRITLEPNTTYTMSSNCPLYNVGALVAMGNVGETFTTASNGVYPNHPITRTTDGNGELMIGLRTNGSSYTPADYDTMLNEGSTPLPYEPYGKQKFPFYTNGSNLSDYTIYGNNGGVGDSVGNIFPTTFSHTGVSDDNGNTGTYTTRLFSNLIEIEPSTQYAFKIEGTVGGEDLSMNRLIYFDASQNFLSRDSSVLLQSTGTFTTLSTAKYVALDIRTQTLTSDIDESDITFGMLNLGATPYPNNYVIPVICGGSTTNVYLASPIGDGDSINYATAQVAIPTVDGVNNLICDTSVPPKKVSLTYTGWHSDLDGLQTEITSTNKLSADLVDDTSSTNKFVTSAEKTTISKAVTTDDIGLGTDYLIYNGIRVYISATEPTGNIPDNSIWLGGVMT